MILGENLEKLLENAEVSVENRKLCIVQFHIKKSGWERLHFHKKSFEMYQVNSGKMTIVFEKEGKRERIQILPGKDNYFILEPGTEHMIYFERDSDITIYRLSVRRIASVAADTFSAKI